MNLAFFSAWEGCKSLCSLKSFFWYAPLLSRASILFPVFFSPIWIPSGYTWGNFSCWWLDGLQRPLITDMGGDFLYPPGREKELGLSLMGGGRFSRWATCQENDSAQLSVDKCYFHLRVDVSPCCVFLKEDKNQHMTRGNPGDPVPSHTLIRKLRHKEVISFPS